MKIWYNISPNRMTYNLPGKRITSENLAGQVTTTAWDCCHKVSVTEPDGSTTTWDYDDEGRMIASSRLIPLDMTNVTWLTPCLDYVVEWHVGPDRARRGRQGCKGGPFQRQMARV